MKKLALAAAAALMLCSAVQAQPMLADRHVERGQQCAACHMESPPAKAVDAQTCLNCHGGYDKLKERTKDSKVNPHYTHMLEQPCSECHKGHQQSVNMCNDCHKFEFKVP